MKRLCGLGLSIAVLSACSSKDEGNTPAADTGTPVTDTGVDTMVSGPVDLQIDTYNIGLAGVGVRHEGARRPVVLAELGKLTGDVLCIQEAWQESDKVAVQNALKANYPHTAWAKTNLDSKIEDSKDAAGMTPPPPLAPCAGQEADLDTAIKCLADNCATADGKVTSTACAKDKCVVATATIFAATNKSCYACLASNLASEKISDIAPNCKKAGYGLGFGGQSSVMIASKHPLSDIQHKIMPGCWQQRVVTRATATINNGAKVDVYCNHLTPVIIGDDFIPYVCPWGGSGTTEQSKWESEQLLQTKQITAWAATRMNRSVILGDFNASPMAMGLDAHGQLTLDELAKSYVQALVGPASCTYCKDNSLTDAGENTWLDHIWLKGIDKSAVKSTLVTFKGTPVTTGDAAEAKVPTSDHYGFRAVVTVAP